MHGRLLLEVNENCAHIFKVDVRRVKNDLFIFFGCAFLGSGRRGAKIIPIVPSFLERGLAGLDFVLSNTDYDLICGILKRKRNRRIYLDHNIRKGLAISIFSGLMS
jgi:hypothetical protein